MRRALKAIVPILVVTFATLTAVEAAEPADPPLAEPVGLQRNPTVGEDLIRLKDLFTGVTGSIAERAVAHAPPPGEQKVIDTRTLATLSARYRVGWKPETRFDRVVVTRTSAQVDEATIRAALLRAYMDQAGAFTGAASLDMKLDESFVTIHLPTGSDTDVAVERFDHDRSSGRFSAVIRAPADGGPTAKRRRLSGQVLAVTDVPVLNRAVRHGEVIQPQDIDWIQVRADRVRRNFALTEDELVGQTPRRRIGAGELVRVSDVQAPIVVPKGTVITMALHSGFMVLTAQGRAVEDGAMGETIRVINTTTNRVVHARVVRPDLVEVRPHNQLVLR